MLLKCYVYSPIFIISFQIQLRIQLTYVRTPCSQTSSRRPYAQLGVVAEIDVEMPGACVHKNYYWKCP